MTLGLGNASMYLKRGSMYKKTTVDLPFLMAVLNKIYNGAQEINEQNI